MTATDLAAITCLSLKVAFAATLAIVPIGLLLALVLARCRFPGKLFVEAIVLLPMVLPPVAVGLALLSALSPNHWLGGVLNSLFGHGLLLTWWAAAIAAFFVALPLFVKTAQQAITAVPKRLEDLARTLGKSAVTVFFSVTLPLIWRGLLQGALLAFARALGEFGATSLVAGIIPGRTETLALGIYDRIVNGHDSEAWLMTGVAVALAFTAVFLSQIFARQMSVRLEGEQR